MVEALGHDARILLIVASQSYRFDVLINTLDHVRPVQRCLHRLTVAKGQWDWRSAKVEVTVEPNTVTRDNLVATPDRRLCSLETPIAEASGDYLSIDRFRHE